MKVRVGLNIHDSDQEPIAISLDFDEAMQYESSQNMDYFLDRAWFYQFPDDWEEEDKEAWKDPKVKLVPETIDELIELAHQRGFFVNNLFQCGPDKPDRWQCNLKRGTEWFEFGVGSSPREAVFNALYNAHVVDTYCGPYVKKKLRRDR